MLRRSPHTPHTWSGSDAGVRHVPPPAAGPRSARSASSGSRRRTWLLVLRIGLWRLRPVLVIVLVTAGLAVGAGHLAPPPPRTQPVVVTARAVPAGRPLTAADLRVVQMTPRVVPEGALAEADGLVGRGAAVALPRGLPVLAPLLEGDRFGLDPPSGTVVVPVRLTDATTAGFLRVGDHIDLVVPGSGYADMLGADGAVAADPQLLAGRALVVEVGSDEQATSGSGWGGLDGSPSELVVMVAVSPADGRRLAGADEGSLGAVLVG